MKWTGIAAVCLVAAGLTAGAKEQPATTPRARIALTFDDLPAHGPLPPAVTRANVARSILRVLRQHGAPRTYGFINAKQVETNPADAEVLRLWRAEGHPLGNHTFSHMDLHANAVGAFEQDIAANEPTLQTLMGQEDWRWFRFPYLREGDTPDKYRATRILLARHRYRVAQVTVSFHDYAYNEPYVRCLARGDSDAVAWLERTYLERAFDSLAEGREAARTVFGRDIDHVMLLHVGAFQTVMLPRLLELLQRGGFELTTLEAAQADPAYAVLPHSAPASGTLLEQLAPRSAAASAANGEVFQALAALCRTEE